MSLKWLGDTNFNNPKEKLVTSYTYNLNRIADVSSINYTTSILDSVGHGLTNGSVVYLLPKIDNGSVYSTIYLPTGLNYSTAYYVINSTTNTFQLSATSGGTAITLTQGGQTNLAKWNLELSDSNSLSINNLPPRYRYKVRFYGRSLRNSVYVFFQPNGFPYSGVLMSGSSSYNNNPGNVAGGNMLMYREYDVDFRFYANYKVKGCDFGTNNSTSVSSRIIDYQTFCTDMSFYNKPITYINFNQFEIANGTTVEVYEVEQ